MDLGAFSQSVALSFNAQSPLTFGMKAHLTGTNIMPFSQAEQVKLVFIYLHYLYVAATGAFLKQSSLAHATLTEVGSRLSHKGGWGAERQFERHRSR